MGSGKHRSGSPKGQNDTVLFALRDFETRINKNIKVLDEKQRKFEVEFGNVLDHINTIISLQRAYAPTQTKFFNFCQNNMGIPFTEMADDIKFNAYIQFMEACLATPESTYNKMLNQVIDKRLGLTLLDATDTPQRGHVAYIMWNFEHEGQIIAGQRMPTLYNLGSDELLVDDHIMKMKHGETRGFKVNFSENHPHSLLAGKSGSLTVTLIGFKKYLTQQEVAPRELTQEQKKQIWQKNYRATEIM